MACEEHRPNLTWSSGRKLCNGREDNAPHCTIEFYVGMVRLSVHIDPGTSADPSAAVSPDYIA